jgi:salicylate hydroxylase
MESMYEFHMFHIAHSYVLTISQSQLRQSVAPGSPPPYAVGKSCFRWLLPTEELKQYENTIDFVKDPGVFIEWASDDRRLVAYPCSDDKVFNLCAFMPSKDTKTDTHSGGKFQFKTLQEGSLTTSNRHPGNRRQGDHC